MKNGIVVCIHWQREQLTANSQGKGGISHTAHAEESSQVREMGQIPRFSLVTVVVRFKRTKREHQFGHLS